MKNFFLVIVFWITCLAGFAQADSTVAPPNPGQKNFFALKGKILPWLLGNAGGLNVTLGAEQSFFTHHSIGIEGYFYGTQNHHDDFNATDTIDDSKHRYTRDRALVLTYRYYFDEDLHASDGFSFYLGVTGRWGKSTLQQDKYWEDFVITTKEVRKYLAAGPIAGLVIQLREGLNLDIYAGTVYTRKELSCTYYDDSIESGKVSSWDLRLGINLSWWFSW